MAKKKSALTAFHIVTDDGSESFEIGKVAAIDIPKKQIILDQLPDGRWRLNYTASLVPNIQKLHSLRFEVAK